MCIESNKIIYREYIFQEYILKFIVSAFMPIFLVCGYKTFWCYRLLSVLYHKKESKSIHKLKDMQLNTIKFYILWCYIFMNSINQVKQSRILQRKSCFMVLISLNRLHRPGRTRNFSTYFKLTISCRYTQENRW